MRAPSRALLFALLTALACSPATPPPAVADADAPRPTPPPPEPPTTITVRADAPGRGALAIERDITVPLEQALAGIPGLTQLRSVSRSDAATLVLTLAPGTDGDAARSLVYEQLTGARATLPPDILPILAAELAPRARAVHFVLTGDRPGTELRAIAEQLRNDLAATPGVAAIDLCGGRSSRVQIVLDPARLAALAVPLDGLTTSLRTSLRADAPLAPGLQTRLSVRSIDELADIVVKPGPPPVVLRDLARVSLDADLPDCDAARLDGGPVVLGTVLPRRSAASGDFNAAVQARLTALRATLPAGLELRVPDLERVALEGLSVAPGETVPAAARAITAALAAPRSGYLQAHTRVAPGVPLDLELLLEPTEPATEPATAPDALAAALTAIPGIKLRAIDGDLEALTRLVVVGDELETAARIADDLAALARKLPGVRDVDRRWALDPELALDLQRDRMTRLGVAEPELRAVLATALAGVTVGTIVRDGEAIPVQLQLGEPAASDPMARVTALGALQVPTPDGSIPLSELVSFRADTQPHAIVRIDRRRAVEVELRLLDPTARDALQQSMAAELRLPPGYLVRFE